MIREIIAVVFAALAGVAGAEAGQNTALPVPLPPPTVYQIPTPAPLAPPINPGPVVVPPAGLSPSLSQPGPVSPMPVRTSPPYPPAPTPGPIDQQKTQSYRNDLLDQRWRLERNGASPDNPRSRDVQRQIDLPSAQ